MTVETFSKNYNLTQMDVVSILNVKDGLSVVIDMDFLMHFDGGNHVRTEFDMSFFHEFVFIGVHSERDYPSNPRILSQVYRDGVLYLKVDGDDVLIPECDILIHKNVRPYIDHSIQ